MVGGQRHLCLCPSLRVCVCAFASQVCSGLRKAKRSRPSVHPRLTSHARTRRTRAIRARHVASDAVVEQRHLEAVCGGGLCRQHAAPSCPALHSEALSRHTLLQAARAALRCTAANCVAPTSVDKFSHLASNAHGLLRACGPANRHRAAARWLDYPVRWLPRRLPSHFSAGLHRQHR